MPTPAPSSARKFTGRALVALASLGVATLSVGGLAACGGGGGSGAGDTLPGLILVDFIQAGQDNVPLNRVLEFRFSSAIDPNSVGPSSLQIREGPLFGSQVFGKYIIQGSTIFFEPALPGLCDYSDGGLQPGLDYRVTALGAPEEFAIRNLAGAPLQSTLSEGLTFHTRSDTSPELFEDQKPGLLPSVLSTTPADQTANLPVGSSNQVVILFSENLDPCTVNDTTIFFEQHATGPFFPSNDQTPGDPTSWGSGNPTTPPRKIRATFSLTQDRLTTRLTMTPVFGEFPDNALLVVRVTNQVRDFGGNPMIPKSISFTTEDRIAQTKSTTFEFDGDVPIDTNVSTAEVNTARALSKVQGFLLVAGDGDNGSLANINSGSGPDSSKGPPGCTATFGGISNDGLPDDFDPPNDVLLSTGNTRNTCLNATDGSTAVTFEYRSFRIRSNVTVRITGVNPAIILVRGDINIEAGGRLLVRSDGGGGGPPTSNGANGVGSSTVTQPAGGVGVAGGGNGGGAKIEASSNIQYSENGTAGFGSPDAFLSPGLGGAVSPIRQGAGRGAVGVWIVQTVQGGRGSPSGGGGGHAAAGVPGQALGTDAMRVLMSSFTDGAAGGTYGAISGKMPTAEAGSGGGGGGPSSAATVSPTSTTSFTSSGGAGGAGGGFVDLTTNNNIRIFGSIDAAGGMGGNGGTETFSSSGGGGGGSGGGIRLLTPTSIIFGAGAVLTAGGGAGGNGGNPHIAGATTNPGGAGGVGRIVLEDSDSVITGFGGGTVVPTEGQTGFYRGTFDGTRFQGGGLRPFAVTQIIDIGPSSPTYLTPVAADFLAGIPAIASRGVSNTSIHIEAQGFTANPDGTPTDSSTGWRSVGYFTDSGSETVPTWVPDATPSALDVASAGGLLPGNVAPAGIAQLNGRQFVQFRFTFFLPSTIGPFDAGPYIDRWTLNFQYDQ